MEILHNLFKASPEAALFLSLAIGYAVGKIQFGRFQFGGVAGSLIAAVLISQVGVTIDPGIKAVAFALFIYAVGFESGPQFFNSLNRSALREIAMAVFLAATALVTVIVCARIGGLDKGLAAGIAAGGLTQSAIIGTAGDTLNRLGLPVEEVARQQSEIAIGYAVTYIFGSLGPILVCLMLVPRLYGRDIREDAVKAERALAGGGLVLGRGDVAAAPDLVGRTYTVTAAAGRTVGEIEAAAQRITIERVRRGDAAPAVEPGLRLQAGDHVLVVGRRDAVVAAAPGIGAEEAAAAGMEMVLHLRDVVFTRPGANGKTIGELKAQADATARHGVYIAGITRMERPLPVLDGTALHHGDVITLQGAASDVDRAARLLGYEIAPSDKTDFVYLGLGILLGLLVGLITARVGGIPLTLGSGGGALLSGLVFGWLRAKHPTFGAMPSAAGQILKDFGLAAFVACVGLSSGAQAWTTLQESGAAIFVLGLVVTLVPLVLTLLFGRYVLRYDNAAILAGALSGSRSANPAFGAVLDKAGNSVPTVPFAITYAMANVLLTILGPLVVGLV
ncbi:aspartate-alanine antiporter [Inquilinus sp. CA228]|uniref:aspartate-alanine antiporter n=1 Tax=Inquilinus sp. CA228 TaxID=3455609 RepID=UPI003F8D66FC